MAEPTLKDVIDQLKKNNDSLERQNAEVSSAVIALGNAIKGLTGNKNLKALDNLEASREKRAGRKDKERVAAGAGGKTRGSFGMLGGALAGAGVGIGIIFGNYLSGAMRNPSAAQKQFPNLLLGFALAEATGLFGLVVALIILFAF